MASLRLGSFLEGTTAYQNAVAAQRAKDEERRTIEAKRLDEARRAKEQPKAVVVRYMFPVLPTQVDGAFKPLPITIMRAVAEQYGYKVKDLRGHGRGFNLVKCRHRAIAEVKRIHPTISSPRLGRLFNRDHATILSALKNIDRPRAHEAGRLAPEVINRVKALRMAGHTHRYISAQTGVTPWTVGRVLTREGIQ